MSKKKKKQRGTGKPKPGKESVVSPEIQQAAETRTAVAANVAWMLALMSTVTAEAIGLACRWYTAFVEPVELLTVLSAVMLFVAVISGTLTLFMIPVVFRFSKARPPTFILQVAILAGGLPLVVVALQMFLANQ